MKTKLPNNLLGILEDTGEQGEQGLEGEACLIMMSQSLLGKQAWSIETLSALRMASPDRAVHGGPWP